MVYKQCEFIYARFVGNPENRCGEEGVFTVKRMDGEQDSVGKILCPKHYTQTTGIVKSVRPPS